MQACKNFGFFPAAITAHNDMEHKVLNQRFCDSSKMAVTLHPAPLCGRRPLSFAATCARKYLGPAGHIRASAGQDTATSSVRSLRAPPPGQGPHRTMPRMFSHVSTWLQEANLHFWDNPIEFTRPEQTFTKIHTTWVGVFEKTLKRKHYSPQSKRNSKHSAPTPFRSNSSDHAACAIHGNLGHVHHQTCCLLSRVDFEMCS